MLKLGRQRSYPGRRVELATCRQPVEAGILRLKLHREEGWALRRRGPIVERHGRRGAGTTNGTPFPAHALRQQDAT